MTHRYNKKKGRGVWINMKQQSICMFISKVSSSRNKDRQGISALDFHKTQETQGDNGNWFPFPQIWDENSLSVDVREMLCIGSHHPSVTWYLLPTGTARDASPTTPWPQSRYWHSRTSSAAGSNPISSRKSHREQSAVMGTRQAILTSHADSPSYINVCNKKFTTLGDSQHCFFAASLVRSRAKLVEGMLHKHFF